jgi:hypothetical protein
LDIVVLAALAAWLFDVVLPASTDAALRLPIPPWYSSWFLLATVWLAVACLVFVFTEPLHLHLTQFRSFPRYPPLWFSVVLGIIGGALSQRLPPRLQPLMTSSEWQQWQVVTPLLVAAFIGVLARHFATPSPATQRIPTLRSLVPEQWSDLETWVTSEEPASDDFFDHGPVVSRIASALLSSDQDRAIALLGGYGSGKTSILGWVRHELSAARKPLWVVADVNCWGIQRPEDAPRIALQSMLQALERHVDVQGFRELPSNYQRLMAAEPTGFLRRLVGAAPAPQPLDELARLTPLLRALNARLVIFVEDAERAGSALDTRHLEALLWKLRDVARVSFVLSFDPTHLPTDYRKLCDIIEVVPRLEPARVGRVLGVAYSHWLSDFTFVEPFSDRTKRDRMAVGEPGNTLLAYVRRVHGDTPVHALTALLNSPRNIKHFIRRMESAWQRLHGEVDIDDLIVLTALRTGGDRAFDFLVRNIDLARQKTDRFTTNVKPSWEALLAHESDKASVEALVDLLEIEQLRGEHLQVGGERPQAVHLDEPVDYFRRALSERLTPDDVPDQTVLADIDEWRASRTGAMAGHLLTPDSDSSKYLRVWRHFATRLSTVELVELAEQIVSHVVVEMGSAASMDHSGLGAVCGACLEARSGYDWYADWLTDALAKVLPLSLNLANDLFSNFALVNAAPVGPERRRTIRADLVAAAKRTFVSADALRQSLNAQHHSALNRLVMGPHREGFEGVEQWQWLAPVLLESARQDGALLVPQLAILLMDSDHGPIVRGDDDKVHTEWQYRLNVERLKGMFAADVKGTLALLASAVSSEDYVAQVADQARALLQEMDRSQDDRKDDGDVLPKDGVTE